MKEQEVRTELEKRRKLEPSTYLMGTTAYALLGDITRDKEDIFSAYDETDDYYIGSWVTGFGFFDVLFPKATSRHLTDEEKETYSKKYVQVASHPAYKLDIK